MVPDYVTNTQTDTTTHNKTQTDKQEDQSNKGIFPKTIHDFLHNKSYSKAILISEKDRVH